MDKTQEEIYNPIAPENLAEFEKEDLHYIICAYILSKKNISCAIQRYKELAAEQKFYQQVEKKQYLYIVGQLEKWLNILNKYEFQVTDYASINQLGWLDAATTMKDPELQAGKPSIPIIYLDCYSRLTGKTPAEILEGYTLEDVEKEFGEEKQEYGGMQR